MTDRKTHISEQKIFEKKIFFNYPQEPEVCWEEVAAEIFFRIEPTKLR